MDHPDHFDPAGRKGVEDGPASSCFAYILLLHINHHHPSANNRIVCISDKQLSFIIISMTIIIILYHDHLHEHDDDHDCLHDFDDDHYEHDHVHDHEDEHDHFYAYDDAHNDHDHHYEVGVILWPLLGAIVTLPPYDIT